MTNYIENIKGVFGMYKQLGEKAIAQVADEQLNWQANDDCNSIAVIVKHMRGNMLSRWTDFLTTDGEKPWRQRDAEFDNDITSRTQLMEQWEEGWQCLFAALESISESDLNRIVYIRNEGHTVTDAITRQIGHYAYHVGQLVYIAKLRSTEDWKSLSIPRNQSLAYNDAKFAEEKQVKHFTNEVNDKPETGV